jgi:hypothetical protein
LNENLRFDGPVSTYRASPLSSNSPMRGASRRVLRLWQIQGQRKCLQLPELVCFENEGNETEFPVGIVCHGTWGAEFSPVAFVTVDGECLRAWLYQGPER